MPLLSANANIVAGSTLSTSHVGLGVGAHIVANSGSSASAKEHLAVHSAISANSSIHATLSANPVTQLLSGSAVGKGITLAPIPSLFMTLSGQTTGLATVIDQIEIDLSGADGGTGTLSATHLFALQFLTGSTSGHATLKDASPLPIHGAGNTYGFLDLVVILPPYNSIPQPLPPAPQTGNPCCCHNHDVWRPQGPQRVQEEEDCGCGPRGGNVQTNRCLPKQFRLGYMFTYGDLEFCVTDTSGNPLSPYIVTYTMFRVLPGGAVMQAGPSGKPGVMQKVGLYYAVGTAGENGQPGNWLVRWCYQRSFGGATTTVDFPFQVVDSISKPLFGDQTCRVVKYGWD